MVQTRGSGGRSGGRRRWVLRIAVGVVVLVGLAVVLAPAVVGPIVRGQVERGVSGAIAGRVEVGRVSLSWLGSQRVEGVRLLDPDGGEVAFVDVRLGRSLLGLATNWRDLGTLTVGGRASVVRGADGTTNVERAGAPATPRPTEPATEPLALPMGLKGAIALDGLSVVYSDSALAEQTGGRIGAVAVRDLRGGRASRSAGRGRSRSTDARRRERPQRTWRTAGWSRSRVGWRA